MQTALSAEHFHNEEAAYEFVEARLWPHGPTCPHCGAILELERFPRRRDNFRCAWEHIESYVRSNYQPEAQVGEHLVWRRKESSTTEARVE